MNGNLNNNQHIPAWKRIGLKLKYAKDYDEVYPIHEPPLAESAEITSKSLVENDEPRFYEDISISKKRRKLEHRPEHSKPSLRDDLVGDTVEPSAVVSVESAFDNQDHEIIIPQRSNPPIPSNTDLHIQAQSKPEGRRKSVTFTPETKQDDGFSASNLFKQSSLLGHATTNDDQESSPEPEIILSPRKSKQARKQAKGGADHIAPIDSQQNNSETVLPEFVRYLQLFYSDKDSWKFNKKKQTDLLKNLFDTSRVGPEFNDAVLQYIDGLKGVPARQRLAENATDILKDIASRDDETEVVSGMESEQARLDAYMDALHCQVARHEALGLRISETDDAREREERERLEKGKRAEAVLQQLLEKELYPDSPQVPTPATTATPPQNRKHESDQEIDNSTSKSGTTAGRKKRKARTQASSPSSSDTDTGSDSNNTSKRPKGPTTVSEALGFRSQPPAPERRPDTAKPTGKKVIFDDDFLNERFPQKKTYNETAPKRKAGEAKAKPRGFAYTHGNRADESGSEDED